jgi:hypothetical protein
LLYWWVRVPRFKKPVAKTEWALLLFVIVVLFFSYIFHKVGSACSSVAISSLELHILILHPILSENNLCRSNGNSKNKNRSNTLFKIATLLQDFSCS